MSDHWAKWPSRPHRHKSRGLTSRNPSRFDIYLPGTTDPAPPLLVPAEGRQVEKASRQHPAAPPHRKISDEDLSFPASSIRRHIWRCIQTS